ncbi:MAG: hypothetical protein V4543_17930 [Bacteroidota bacterium]
MSRKTDINNALSKSARERAALVVYHYTVLEAIKNGNWHRQPILSAEDAKVLLASFKSDKDKNIYRDYTKLNLRFFNGIKNLLNRKLSFEKQLYKSLFEVSISMKTGKDNKQSKNIIIPFPGDGPAGDDEFVQDFEISMNPEPDIEELKEPYLAFINYYAALKIYASEKSYKNRYYLQLADKYLKDIKSLTETLIAAPAPFNFNEQDYVMLQIRRILAIDFQFKYENQPA